MLPNFLLSKVNQLIDPKAIAFGQSIERIALTTSFSYSQLIKLINCGHAPQIEQPQMTFQHILQFLNK